VDHPLEDLVPRIDWTPFFATWELKGHYPEILSDRAHRRQARSLHADAVAMLDRIAAERLLRASAVVGFLAANAVGDDIELYTSTDRAGSPGSADTAPAAAEAAAGRTSPSRLRRAADVGILDYVGAFAVTAGLGIAETLRCSRPPTTTTTRSS